MLKNVSHTYMYFKFTLLVLQFQANFFLLIIFFITVFLEFSTANLFMTPYQSVMFCTAFDLQI